MTWLLPIRKQGSSRGKVTWVLEEEYIGDVANANDWETSREPDDLSTGVVEGLWFTPATLGKICIRIQKLAPTRILYRPLQNKCLIHSCCHGFFTIMNPTQQFLIPDNHASQALPVATHETRWAVLPGSWQGCSPWSFKNVRLFRPFWEDSPFNILYKRSFSLYSALRYSILAYPKIPSPQSDL